MILPQLFVYLQSKLKDLTIIKRKMAVKNNYISVAYQLYVKDGENEKEELAEECSVEHPFMFISKLGAVL